MKAINNYVMIEPVKQDKSPGGLQLPNELRDPCVGVVCHNFYPSPYCFDNIAGYISGEKVLYNLSDVVAEYDGKHFIENSKIIATFKE